MNYGDEKRALCMVGKMVRIGAFQGLVRSDALVLRVSSHVVLKSIFPSNTPPASRIAVRVHLPYS